MSEAESDQTWAKHNGCAGPLTQPRNYSATFISRDPESPGRIVPTTAIYWKWEGCPAAAPVEYYQIVGCPHGGALEIDGREPLPPPNPSASPGNPRPKLFRAPDPRSFCWVSGDPFWIVFGFWQKVEQALLLEERAAPSAPAPAVAAPAPSVAITPVFSAGESGIACWRIPALIDATPHKATPHKGALAARGERGQRLLAFAEARIDNCNDKTGKMMAMKRSVSAASNPPSPNLSPALPESAEVWARHRRTAGLAGQRRPSSSATMPRAPRLATPCGIPSPCTTAGETL